MTDEETEQIELLISEEDAARIAELKVLLQKDRKVEPEVTNSPPTLVSLLTATGAPVSVIGDAVKHRSIVASRKILKGEVILVEEATGAFLCRSPGTDTVYSMMLAKKENKDDVSHLSSASSSVDKSSQQRTLCTLPPWSRLRLLRDTLVLAPRFAGRAEEAYSLLFQLTALGSADHEIWNKAPTLPPGAVTGDEEEEVGGDISALEVSTRVQLLHAISQCNGFAVALPEEDSEWKRALLWLLLGRVVLPSDRMRLFDDVSPLSHVTGFFALASLFNHACGDAANVSYAESLWAEGADFPVVTLRALRDIEQGEECNISYLSDADCALPVSERRYKLLMTYRFRCRCTICIQEMKAEQGGLQDGEKDKEKEEGADPLMEYFMCGLGFESVLSFFDMGGKYPQPIVKREEESEVTEESSA
jgi:hypothetical protein